MPAFSRLRHAPEHENRPENEVQVLRVLLHRVEFQYVVVGERVEIEAFDVSSVEHYKRQLLDAIVIVGIAQFYTQALEAVTFVKIRMKEAYTHSFLNQYTSILILLEVERGESDSKLDWPEMRMMRFSGY